MDLMTLEHQSLLVYFVNKKSLMPVTEIIDDESEKLLELVGQQVIVGVTSIGSKIEKVRVESHRLIERTLPELAPALYRGMTIATADYSKAKPVIDMMNLSEKHLPLIYATDTLNQIPYLYKGELELHPIMSWAQDIVKSSTPANI